jgi:hypothetical protein
MNGCMHSVQISRYGIERAGGKVDCRASLWIYNAIVINSEESKVRRSYVCMYECTTTTTINAYLRSHAETKGIATSYRGGSSWSVTPSRIILQPLASQGTKPPSA